MQRLGECSKCGRVRRLPLLCAALALSCVSSLGYSQQQAPTAGDALRDVQEGQPKIPPSRAPAPIEVKPETRRAIKQAPGVKVDVKAFRFSGATAVSEQALQAQVQSFVGPDKTFDDLQGAVDAVSEYLQRQGYIVGQAFLPEQQIADGVIEIAVLEGRIGEVKLEVDEGVPISRHIVEGLLSSLRPGTIMHRDTLERALFLVSDLRGIAVRSVVEPGGAPGTSNLVVKIASSKRIDGLIEFDNHSSRFTGDYRLGGGVNVNSPFKRGDLLSFRGLVGVPGGGADLDFGRISYLSPVGIYGTKLGVAALRLNYHLGTSLFDPVNQSGRSTVASVFGLHPIIRTRNLNLFGQASFDVRKFSDNRQAVGIVSDRKTEVGTFSLVGDTRDAYLGGGINNVSIAYTAGDLDIQTPADLVADQSAGGRRTAGSYGKLNGSVARLNSLTASTVLFVSYSFQLASKNLDASEKFGLGGPTAVRAYGLGEATSDEAQLLTAELRMGLPQSTIVPGNFVASLFYDFARGRLNKEPLPIETPTNIRTLQGFGFGLNWGRQDDFLIRASLAWRLSGPPTSDPADRTPRLFFTLQKYL